MEQENLLNPEKEINVTDTSMTSEKTVETSFEKEGLSPKKPAGIPPEKPEDAKEDVGKNTEVPIIDFSLLDTETIVEKAGQLLKDHEIPEIRTMLDGIAPVFEKKYREEKARFLKEAGKPEQPEKEEEKSEPLEYKPEVRKAFDTLYREYKDKKARYLKAQEAKREENLAKKLEVIEELKQLILKEETLQKTFQEFRDIQEKWRQIGPVPQSRLNGLLETYHLHVENFYNYVKINKELRDLDLKRNLEDKLALCEEAEKLSEGIYIGDAFRQLQLLHARWKEVGPIPKEQKEEVWERFKKATTLINEEYHKFIEGLKREQEDNLKVKQDICKRAEEITEKEYVSVSQWNSATKNILELQQEWKQSGTVSQKERNKLYKQFRAVCDRFFDKKREFYKVFEQEQEKNLELKIKLCEKVEAVKDSDDWKRTSSRIISYQQEWKKIGPAPRKYSNKVWKRFRAACDEFFARKEEFFKDINEEQEKNLHRKEALLEEIRGFVLTGKEKSDLEKLKDFQCRWNEIGFVPIKKKDEIQEVFHAAMNALYDRMDLNEFDKNIAKFQVKIDSMQNGDDHRILNEKDRLTGKIRQLETDIQTWENNIGFIAESEKSEALIKNLNSKIAEAKERLSLMIEKLKTLNDMINE